MNCCPSVTTRADNSLRRGTQHVLYRPMTDYRYRDFYHIMRNSLSIPATSTYGILRGVCADDCSHSYTE